MSTWCPGHSRQTTMIKDIMFFSFSSYFSKQSAKLAIFRSIIMTHSRNFADFLENCRTFLQWTFGNLRTVLPRNLKIRNQISGIWNLACSKSEMRAQSQNRLIRFAPRNGRPTCSIPTGRVSLTYFSITRPWSSWLGSTA